MIGGGEGSSEMTGWKVVVLINVLNSYWAISLSFPFRVLPQRPRDISDAPAHLKS